MSAQAVFLVGSTGVLHTQLPQWADRWASCSTSMIYTGPTGQPVR